jgi:hypothetical protein
MRQRGQLYARGTPRTISRQRSEGTAEYTADAALPVQMLHNIENTLVLVLRACLSLDLAVM